MGSDPDECDGTGEVTWRLPANSVECPMKTHIIMDRRGDTRHEFDAACPVALAEAEERFRDLTGKGFRAVALGTDGKVLMRRFDPEVEQTLFIPQLVGG